MLRNICISKAQFFTLFKSIFAIGTTHPEIGNQGSKIIQLITFNETPRTNRKKKVIIITYLSILKRGRFRNFIQVSNIPICKILFYYRSVDCLKYYLNGLGKIETASPPNHTHYKTFWVL